MDRGITNLELIIFDCDGVLVDSERVANEVFAKVIAEECGITLSMQEMIQKFVGRSTRQCIDIVGDMLGKEPPPQLEQRYKEDINAALAATVSAVSGIESILEEIDLPFCVASSGSHEKMQMTLGRTGLLHYFSGRIYSTSDVDRGKPFPDIYLHAARNMGVQKPEKCLVIEDSPPGVQGGVAAGMTVFGYAELMDENSLRTAGAHHIFKDMSELISEIDRYFPPSIQ